VASLSAVLARPDHLWSPAHVGTICEPDICPDARRLAVKYTGGDLGPDLHSGDVLSLAFQTEVSALGRVVLADAPALDWIGLRRLVRCGSGWALVTNHSLNRPILVTEDVQILAVLHQRVDLIPIAD
jgi:hypothetical protein